MTGTAWGEGGEGREAEFEVSLTEARRTRRGEEGRVKGESFLLFLYLRVLRASVRLIAS
jgi:hypothetical protein